MTIETVGIIVEALVFYRQQKEKDLEEAKAARLSKQALKEMYVAEALEESTARAKLNRVSTTLAEFRSLRAAQLNDTPPEKHNNGTPKAVNIWLAYLRDQYSTAILSDEDLDVLRKLQTVF